MAISSVRDYVNEFDGIKAIKDRIATMESQLTALKAQCKTSITNLKAMADYNTNLSTSEKSEIDNINSGL